MFCRDGGSSCGGCSRSWSISCSGSGRNKYYAISSLFPASPVEVLTNC